MYQELIGRATALCGEKNFVVNAANVAAMILDEVDNLNWAGVYIWTGRELLLGPFAGKPACVRIAPGKGVCGAAATRRETVVVRDVHEFPGHIACDAASNSEIVVPLIKDGELYGVLDIDSPLKDRFHPAEVQAFEAIARALMEFSDMESIREYYSKY
ncbi:MAG: GAF domain-containing protein [Candidatus Kapaibacterium sp.]